jgi:hypothetical protein
MSGPQDRRFAGERSLSGNVARIGQRESRDLSYFVIAGTDPAIHDATPLVSWRQTMRAFVLALGFILAPALALAETIAPSDTQRYVGKSVTVEGVVSEVNSTDRAGVTFLDMGGHYPDNAFTAVILKNDAGKFPDVKALEGKTIDVTGTIKLYKGKTEIMLNDAGQIGLK